MALRRAQSSSNPSSSDDPADDSFDESLRIIKRPYGLISLISFCILSLIVLTQNMSCGGGGQLAEIDLGSGPNC